MKLSRCSLQRFKCRTARWRKPQNISGQTCVRIHSQAGHWRKLSYARLGCCTNSWLAYCSDCAFTGVRLGRKRQWVLVCLLSTVLMQYNCLPGQYSEVLKERFLDDTATSVAGRWGRWHCCLNMSTLLMSRADMSEQQCQRPDAWDCMQGLQPSA